MARHDNPFALLDEEGAEDVMSVIAKAEAEAKLAKEREEEAEKRRQRHMKLQRYNEPRGHQQQQQQQQQNARQNGDIAVNHNYNDAGRGGFRRGGYGGQYSRGYYEEGRGGRGRGRGIASNFGARGHDVKVQDSGEGLEQRTNTGSRPVGYENGTYDNGNRYYIRGEGRGYDRDRRAFGGGEGHQYWGGNGRYEKGQRWVATEKKEDVGNGKEGSETNANNADGGPGGDIAMIQKESNPDEAAETAKVLSEVASEKQHGEEEEQEAKHRREEVEVRRKEEEEEAKEMTLEQYEKLLMEKRKALEVVKTDVRRVDEEEFKGMQLVDKKKVDTISDNTKSQKENLKKKSSFDNEEKARKPISINEFLKPAKGEKYYGPPPYARSHATRGRGPGHNEHTGSREATTAANNVRPHRRLEQDGFKEGGYAANKGGIRIGNVNKEHPPGPGVAPYSEGSNAGHSSNNEPPPHYGVAGYPVSMVTNAYQELFPALGRPASPALDKNPK